MKKLAFFILLSLVTLGVSAQSNLKWNVNAGIGMSNWYGDEMIRMVQMLNLLIKWV